MQSESIADLQARIQQMQSTISYLEKMMCTLLEAKK
jgi:prefoldin subunit 5